MGIASCDAARGGLDGAPFGLRFGEVRFGVSDHSAALTKTRIRTRTRDVEKRPPVNVGDGPGWRLNENTGETEIGE